MQPGVGRGDFPPLTALSFMSEVLVDRIVILVDTLPKRAICWANRVLGDAVALRTWVYIRGTCPINPLWYA